MEESPSKRRRLSPPSQETTVPASRLARPSYASPTRSSLLRNHPEILDRRLSSSPAKPSPLRSAFVPNYSPDPGSSPSPSEPLVREEGPRPQNQDNSILASEPAGRLGSRSEPNSHESEEPDELSSPTPAVANARLGLPEPPPKRSPAKPVPRPLPPPGPENDDELDQLFSSRPRQLVHLGVAAPTHPEPELPPSSSDPVTSTPPRGIHSSPSRWKERRRKQFKSSPLKPRPERPEPLAETRTQAPSRALAAQRLDPSTDERRKVPHYDPFSDRRKEIEALKKEADALRNDLDITRKENERIRLMHSTGRILASTDEKVVRETLERHLVPLDPNRKLSQAKSMAKAALNPKALFSLGKPPSTSVPQDHEKDLETIQSHHPVSMTAAEQLPYLHLFSPFDVASNVSMLPDAPGQPPRQRHSITMRSRDVSGLFHARLEVTVRTSDFSVTELRVPALEPSAAAELGPFIHNVCEGECNRTMQRNVGVLGWAIAEWHNTAVQRAQFWLSLEKRVSAKGGVRELARRRFEKKRKRKRSGRGGEGEEEDGDGDEDEDNGGRSGVVASNTYSRTDVLRYMGRQAFEVDVSSPGDQHDASLRFEWKISFDWTGEAQNALSVKVGAPGKWHSTDERGALGKVSQLFGNLVDQGETKQEAVETIVALLVGRGG